MLRNELWRSVSEPIAERDLLICRRLEQSYELQLRGPDILNEVALVAPNHADIASMEILGRDARSGVIYRHSPVALYPILPFIGIRMPVHFAHTSRLDRHQRRCNSRRHFEG